MRVTFLEWMLIGVPAMLTFLPLAWFLNTFVMFPSSMKEIEGGRDYVRNEWAKLGPMNAGERGTLVVFAVTITLWMTAPLLAQVRIGDLAPLEGLSDAGIAVGAAIALFLIPVKGAQDTLMDWETATKLPWGVLILFGGGLALASAAEVNGVPGYIGSLAAGFAGWPFWAVLLAIIAIMVFMSELPRHGAGGHHAAHPRGRAGPRHSRGSAARADGRCELCVHDAGGTPRTPSSRTGLVRMPDMMKAGLWLNLAGILLIYALTYAVFTPVLGLLYCESESPRSEPVGRVAKEIGASRGTALQQTAASSPHLEVRHGNECRRDDNEFISGPDRQPPDRPSGP